MFFVMILRDPRPQCRWVATVGRRAGIDAVHEWCTKNLGYDDFRWFSILSHDHDAVVLDVHFFHEETYQKFFEYFQNEYVEPEEPAPQEQPKEEIAQNQTQV